jgi:hypothetical protein
MNDCVDQQVLATLEALAASTGSTINEVVARAQLSPVLMRQIFDAEFAALAEEPALDRVSLDEVLDQETGVIDG